MLSEATPIFSESRHCRCCLAWHSDVIISNLTITLSGLSDFSSLCCLEITFNMLISRFTRQIQHDSARFGTIWHDSITIMPMITWCMVFYMVSLETYPIYLNLVRMLALSTCSECAGDFRNVAQTLSSCLPINHEDDNKHYVSMLLGGIHTNYCWNYDRRQHV